LLGSVRADRNMRFPTLPRFRTPRAQPSASNEWAITRVA